MEIFATFINEYGVSILYAILTFFAGWLGVELKRIYNKYVTDKMKKDVVNTVVKATEQIYKDIHGEEKLCKAVEAASAMMAEKGISVTELELQMLIEAAVAEFNEAFKKD
ncbi:MAG: hypothetical protein IJ499_00620 [Clostridia bacterium]|nr:hypothetical protein [Clostridia bacterium]